MTDDYATQRRLNTQQLLAIYAITAESGHFSRMIVASALRVPPHLLEGRWYGEINRTRRFGLRFDWKCLLNGCVRTYMTVPHCRAELSARLEAIGELFAADPDGDHIKAVEELVAVMEKRTGLHVDDGRRRRRQPKSPKIDEKKDNHLKVVQEMESGVVVNTPPFRLDDVSDGQRMDPPIVKLEQEPPVWASPPFPLFRRMLEPSDESDF